MSTTAVRGVKGVGGTRARIHRCISGFPPDQDNGPSYWIALEPAPGSDLYGSANAIMQIGVITCYDALQPGNICDDGGENETWITWAKGGCNGVVPVFQKASLAPAPNGDITFEITRLSSPQGSYRLSWDSSTTSGYKTISGTDMATSCWASGTGDYTQMEVACERWDAGDGCGIDTAAVHVQGIQVQKAVGGTWADPGLSDADCAVSLPGDGSQAFCNVTGTSNVYFWTVQ